MESLTNANFREWVQRKLTFALISYNLRWRKRQLRAPLPVPWITRWDKFGRHTAVYTHQMALELERYLTPHNVSICDWGARLDGDERHGQAHYQAWLTEKRERLLRRVRKA